MWMIHNDFIFKRDNNRAKKFSHSNSKGGTFYFYF